MIIQYLNDQLKNEYLTEIKQLKNEKLGISVNYMPSKIHGCFQKHFSRVTVKISDGCLGKTCNGNDFYKNLKYVRDILNQFNFSQK
jgi:hypothetical protein